MDHPVERIHEALERILQSSKVRDLACSRLYQTDPWGPVEQDDFINAVARCIVDISAQDLMELLMVIEDRMGRSRDGQRYGPRRIDLDLLLYGEESIDTPSLHIPHPRMTERRFVLQPMMDLVPDLVVNGRTVADHLAMCESSKCEAITESVLNSVPQTLETR